MSGAAGAQFERELESVAVFLVRDKIISRQVTIKTPCAFRCFAIPSQCDIRFTIHMPCMHLDIGKTDQVWMSVLGGSSYSKGAS